jgi:hypothetical protein
VYGNPTGLTDAIGLSPFSDAPGVEPKRGGAFCEVLKEKFDKCAKEAKN